MSAGNKFLDAIGKLSIAAVSQPGAVNIGSELLYGKVETVNPLAIRIDDRGVFSEEQLDLAQGCRAFKITLPHKHEISIVTDIGGVQEPHVHQITSKLTNDVHQGINNEQYLEIEIFRPLKVGDVVKMISLNGGQKYYVVERVEL